MTPELFVGGTDQTSGDATRFRIATIIANFKCELFEAVNSEKPIPLLYNSPALQGRIPVRSFDRSAKDAEFNLRNIFSAIQYIGGVSLTLDATNTLGTNPAANFFKLGSAKYPLSIDLSGSISEASHLENQYYFSADFARLVGNGDNKAKFNPASVQLAATNTKLVPGCGRGHELAGKLRLESTLANGLMLADQNDISVWPGNADYPNAIEAALDPKYSGEIDTTIDFTTTTSFNGGPTWALTHVSLPNGNEGLLNAKREAKNRLSAVFFPICVTTRYRPTNSSKPYTYDPPLPHGTPRWANFLPQCGTKEAMVKKQDLTQRAIETIQRRRVEF
ncbi:hypothetical protein AB9F36_15515 [Rhizobium leguminosarum]|uniref:hypothetical protein n=1 Tax=Rhizobium leguminosarum TaxID=384 RepID=UPI003F9530FF